MSDTELITIPRKTRVFSATYATLPVVGLKAEDLGYATDRKVLYRWSGAAYVPLTIFSGAGLAANIPAAATLPEGSLYYTTDTLLLRQVQAGAWVTIAIPGITTFAALTDIKLVRKTANETVNNSDVLQNDDHLLFAVAANERWQFFIVLEGAIKAASDFKFAFTVPAAGAIRGLTQSGIGALTAGLTATIVDLTASRQETTTVNGTYWILVWGLYVGGANAGNVQLQWAQATAVAEDTQVLINSYIIAHKLA